MADPVIGSAEWAARYGVLHRRTATDVLAELQKRMLDIPLGPTRIPTPFVPLHPPHLVFGDTPTMQLNGTNYTITALDAGGFIVIVDGDTVEATAFSTFDEAVEDLRKRRAVDVEDAAEAERQAEATAACVKEQNRLYAAAAERERTASDGQQAGLNAAYAEARALRDQAQDLKVEDFLPAKA